MIDYIYQNQGIGKKLVRHIIEKVYGDKNIIMQPDGDGYWFWRKFGFVNDNSSKQVTWILKRNKCTNIVRGDDLG